MSADSSPLSSSSPGAGRKPASSALASCRTRPACSSAGSAKSRRAVAARTSLRSRCVTTSCRDRGSTTASQAHVPAGPAASSASSSASRAARAPAQAHDTIRESNLVAASGRLGFECDLGLLQSRERLERERLECARNVLLCRLEPRAVGGAQQPERSESLRPVCVRVLQLSLEPLPRLVTEPDRAQRPALAGEMVAVGVEPKVRRNELLQQPRTDVGRVRKRLFQRPLGDREHPLGEGGRAPNRHELFREYAREGRAIDMSLEGRWLPCRRCRPGGRRYVAAVSSSAPRRPCALAVVRRVASARAHALLWPGRGLELQARRQRAVGEAASRTSVVWRRSQPSECRIDGGLNLDQELEIRTATRDLLALLDLEGSRRLKREL